MAKSMRVNRNNRYSKKRTNNKVTNKKSARRASKRNSRRNNKRNLRGAGNQAGGPGPGAGGPGPGDNGGARDNGGGPGERTYDTASPAQGVENPLYALIKDETNRAEAVGELVTKITGVIQLLSNNILLKESFEKKDIESDEQLSGAIDNAITYVESIAKRETALEGDYQDDNLTDLLTLLNELKNLKGTTYSSDEDYVKEIQKYINDLGVFAASYNYETQAKLDEFRAKVKESRENPQDVYIEVYRALSGLGSKLPEAAALGYGTRPEPAPTPTTTPEPASTAATAAATGGAPVFVKVTAKDGHYEAEIVESPQ